MAVNLLRAQHIGALANISPNTKIPRSSSFGSKKVRFIPTTRITSPSSVRSKHKPVYVRSVEEDRYHQLLAADSVALNHLGFDAPNAPDSPNMPLRHNPGPRSATPVTPPVTMEQGEQLVPIDEVRATDAVSVLRTPVKKVFKGSPLDKELPPKPILRSLESPERRGLVDALDTDILNLNHPVLEPGSSSSDGESLKSFKVASSLGSPSSTGEVEAGTAVVVQGVSGMGLGKAKPIKAIPVRVSTGSPMFRVRGLSSQASNGSLNRRAARCSVGPTLRKTSDCHAIIMGPSPHPPRTSSLPKPVQPSCQPAGQRSTGQISAASRLSRPTKASAAREAEAKKNIPGKVLFSKATANKSSLVPANISIPTNVSSEKTSTRLSGSKTSLTPSTTAPSLKKGLKSRISEIFSNRRRSTEVSVADNKNHTSISDAEDITDLLPTPTPAANPKGASKLITTCRDSGMKEKTASTDNIRTDKRGISMGRMTEKDYAPRDQREREEHRPNAVASDISPENLRTGVKNVIRSRRNAVPGRGDVGSSIPPCTGEDGHGKYIENEVATATRARPQDMTDSEWEAHCGATIDIAEANLREVIRLVNTSGVDNESINRVSDVLQAFGNIIISSRQALMAGIGLRAAITSLIEHSATRVAIVQDVINDANQQTAAMDEVLQRTYAAVQPELVRGARRAREEAGRPSFTQVFS